MTLSSFLKLGFGYALGAGAFVTCLCAALHAGSNHYLQVVLCIFGGVLGWVIGIVNSPLNPKEGQHFSEFLKAVSAVFTGVVIAKLDSFLEPLTGKVATFDGDTLLLRVALFGSCLLVGFLYTFVTRLYWPDSRPCAHTKSTNHSPSAPATNAAVSP